MRVLFLAAAAFLVAPGAASAAASLTVRDVPLHGQRSLAAAGAPRFDMVGLHWRGPGSVEFRTRTLSGRWSPWRQAAPEAEDLPDPGSPETGPARGWRLGNPYWTDASDRITYRLHGRVTRLRAYFVQSAAPKIPLRRLTIANSPPLLTRLSWGANESIRRAPPSYASSVQFALVHHTAGSNSYTAAQSAAIVRGIEVYHVKGNGWNDIGYNFLVDKYGQVFEGRFGGVDKNVIGAHAEGFNTGSTGIALLGTYGSTGPSAAAKTALTNLLAWRLDLAHVDPLSTLAWISGGNARFASGLPVTLRAVSGHRDTGFTSCPGAALYAQLGAIARQAAATGQPKLYAPSVQGTLGGQVRFQAQLTAELPWTVMVTDAAGLPVASGSGTSQAVDWTWDASTAVPGQYNWTISAGDTVRPATGTVGAKPVALTIKAVAATPRTITPNGDGQTDSSSISYTLSAPATVTATLRSPDGRQLAVLFTQQRQPGKQSFKFAAAGIADGRYEIVLSANDGTTTVTAVVPVLVDRTVRKFAVLPAAVSPNGDGVRDDVSFTFELTRAATVKLDVAQAGKPIASVYSAALMPGVQTVGWNGAGTKDGKYAGVLTATNDVGVVSHNALFRIDTVPPLLRAVSFRRLRFKVNEAASVRLTVNGRRIARTVRAGVFSLRVGSRVRTVRIAAEDAAGNLSRTLRYP
jgi:N-acetylmuramoyl-L-alanine amidase-like protein